MTFPLSKLFRINDLVGKLYGNEARPFPEDWPDFVRRYEREIESGIPIGDKAFTPEEVRNLREICWMNITYVFLHGKEVGIEEIRSGRQVIDSYEKVLNFVVGFPARILEALEVEATEENINEFLREVGKREDHPQFAAFKKK